MSAEGKKKRGEAGVSNAKNIPFRYGGSRCDFSTRIGNSSHPRGAGSRLVQAMKLGVMLPNFFASERLFRMTDMAMERCSSEREDYDKAA